MIVLPVHTFFPQSAGGTEVYTLALAQRLQSRGVPVTVVTCGSCLEQETAGVRELDDSYQNVRVVRLFHNLLGTPNPVLYEYENPLLERHLRGLYRRLGAELVHVCHPGNLSMASVVAAKDLGLRVVMTATDFWLVCPTSQLLRHDKSLCPGPVDPAHCLVCTVGQRATTRRWSRVISRIPIPILRLGIRLGGWGAFQGIRYTRMVQALASRAGRLRQLATLVDCIISPSRFLKEQLVHNGMSSSRISVSAHGIELDWIKSQSGTLGGQMRFGFIGQLAWHKGPHLALNAFSRLPRPSSAGLELYGGESDETDYVGDLQLLAARTPEAALKGPFEHDQLAAVLDRIDVLIMPSLWYENTPTILYEAFATRTPVIATGQGGMAELVTDFDGGWLFPRGDVSQLAERMQALVDQPELVSQAAERIRPVRTIDEHTDDVLQIYRIIGLRMP